MKRILLSIAVLMVGAITLSAQDLETATNLFNSGVTAFQEGDVASALSSIEGALSTAEALGEQGADIVKDSKEVLPKILNRLAKEALNNKNYDEAIAKFAAASDKATEYGNNPEIIQDCSSWICKAKQAKATSIMKTSPAEAIALLKDVVAVDSANGNAHLILGQLLAGVGKVSEAETSLLAAAENGQKAKALKVLGTTFLKECQKNQKAGKFTAAIENAKKSYDYAPSANALKLLATSYKGAKQPAEAIAAYEKYVAEFGAKDAKINETYYAIATLAQEAGIKEKAVEYFKKIVSDPKFAAYVTAQLQALGAN